LQDDPTNNQFVGTSVITLNGQAIISQGEMNPTITFLQETVQLQAGTNTLGVTLYGKPGGQIVLDVFANDIAPVAAFIANPASGFVPLSVGFDAMSSSDLNNDIVSYEWDFGDGNTGTGISANNGYDTVNSFNATLTVTDAFGLSDQTTQAIEVLPLPNSLTGRILDTNAFVQDGSLVPVVGVTVSLLGGYCHHHKRHQRGFLSGRHSRRRSGSRPGFRQCQPCPRRFFVCQLP
jgi:PKD repeat protein